MLRLSTSAAATSLGILMFSSGVTFAGTWSPSVSWGLQDGSYSPDYGNTALYEYYGTDGYYHVSPKARFRFTQSAVDAIRNYYYNNDYFYTFDLSVIDEKNSSVSAYYIESSLPNPKFDFDDDPEPFGNGYVDESEVVSLNSYQIQPYSSSSPTEYRTNSWFRVYNKSTTYFQFGSQESYQHWSGEYDVATCGEYICFDTHIDRRYPW